MPRTPKNDDERSPQETERIREQTLKRIFITPPKRRDEMIAWSAALRAANLRSIVMTTIGGRSPKQEGLIDSGPQIDSGGNAASEVSDGDNVSTDTALAICEVAAHGQRDVDNAVVAAEVRSPFEVQYGGVRRVLDIVGAGHGFDRSDVRHSGSPVQEG
jgi:hypothetical protein